MEDEEWNGILIVRSFMDKVQRYRTAIVCASVDRDRIVGETLIEVASVSVRL